jgi:hypothetical protein
MIAGMGIALGAEQFERKYGKAPLFPVCRTAILSSRG